jgi:two-component system LytT family response regulator
MTPAALRVVVAEDERPARAFLVGLLKAIAGVTVVGEASNGAEAIELIEQVHPDLALLDLQMPEVDGLSVIRLVKKRYLPLVVFVTAYDDYAVRAFELNAVDYLTKPVSAGRLAEAVARVRQRLGHHARQREGERLQDAARVYEGHRQAARLDRIPVRRKDDILLVPVSHVASIVAEGELLHLTSARQERYTITYRLKDLEARLDPARFIRIGRGALVNIDHIVRVTPMPGGLYTVRLHNGQELDVSRIQSRLLRDRLLQL